MLNLFTKLATHAQMQPDIIAVRDAHSALTYGDLLKQVTATALTLIQHCPGRAPVAFMAENGLPWALVDLSLLYAGRAALPIPSFFTPSQVQNALETSGAGFLLTEKATPTSETISVIGRYFSISKLASVSVDLPAETAKITFTSGSTAAPKGVCLSRQNMEETASAIVSEVGLENAGIHLALLPLSVLLENVAGLYAVLLAGGTYVALPLDQLGFEKTFMPDFTIMVESLQQTSATSTILVPELLRGLIATLNATRQSLPDMKFLAVGGATVPDQLLQSAAQLKLPVYEGYGLSEVGSVVALNSPHHHRPSTSGKLLPHVKATVSASGELLISKPLFLGYTGQTESLGTFATGDLVALDEDGYLTILGRKSARIITGFSRNISPEWVEAALQAQAVVAQALVYGEGASHLSSLIVPAAPEITPTQLENAIAIVNATLPDYAQILSWQVCAPFTPANGLLTANGRLRRKAIHEKYSGLIKSAN